MARAATIIQPIRSQLTKQGGVLELTAVQVSNGACMPTRTRKCSSEFRILRRGRRARLRNCSGKSHLFIGCVGSDTSGGPGRLRPPGPVMPFVWLDFLYFFPVKLN